MQQDNERSEIELLQLSLTVRSVTPNLALGHI